MYTSMFIRFLFPNFRVAGNAAYILGTLVESENGCLRVISLTANKCGETSKILTDLTNMLTFDDSESVMNAAGTMGTLVSCNISLFSQYTWSKRNIKDSKMLENLNEHLDVSKCAQFVYFSHNFFFFSRNILASF